MIAYVALTLISMVAVEAQGISPEGAASVNEKQAVSVASLSFENAERKMRQVQLRLAQTHIGPDGKAACPVYRIVDVTREKDNPRTVVELPDIPTHDRLGAPPVKRTGALFWDRDAESLYCLVVKCVELQAIVRLYCVVMPDGDENDEAPALQAILLGETSFHVPDRKSRIESVAIEQDDGRLVITGFPQEPGTKVVRVSFDNEKRVFERNHR